jgi:hypothetical protein
MSAFHQREELGLLRDFSAQVQGSSAREWQVPLGTGHPVPEPAPPSATDAQAAAPATVDADRLAAWLLKQAELG